MKGLSIRVGLRQYPGSIRLARMSSSEDIRPKDAPERERRDEESGAKHVSGCIGIYGTTVHATSLKTGLACSSVTMQEACCSLTVQYRC